MTTATVLLALLLLLPLAEAKTTSERPATSKAAPASRTLAAPELPPVVEPPPDPVVEPPPPAPIEEPPPPDPAPAATFPEPTYLDYELDTAIALDAATPSPVTPPFLVLHTAWERRLNGTEVATGSYVSLPLSMGVVSLQLSGGCHDPGPEQAGVWMPVTAELVVVAEPHDQETLLSYRWGSLPPVQEVLTSWTVVPYDSLANPPGPQITVPVNLTGVPVFGIVLVSEPAEPLGVRTFCWAHAELAPEETP